MQSHTLNHVKLSAEWPSFVERFWSDYARENSNTGSSCLETLFDKALNSIV